MSFEPRLSGLEVMILENEPLIMRELVHILEDAGCTIVCQARSVAEARKGLEDFTPDMVFLDYYEIKTHGSPCFATHLHSLAIPYTFVTGETKRNVRDDYRPDAAVVQKPFSGHQIIQAAIDMAM